MITNCIFDLDGTLLDTSDGIIESALYAANELGYDELPYETLLNFVGPPIQNSFMTFYGCNEREAQKAADIFRDYYKEKALFKAVPYEGIFELCQVLKENSVRMAVATYKREDYALKLLQYFGFDKYCDPIHGADNDNILKKADIVNLCRKEMNADHSNCALVGDTVNDAVGAESSNTKFIAVTYGFGFKTKEEADMYHNIGIAGTTLEIAEILLSERP